MRDLVGRGPGGHLPVAIAQRGQAVGAAAHRRDLVQRGDLVARADVAGIDLVVGEILVGQHAVLVADQAILGHDRGIELHLDLHVAGDGQQGGLHLVHQHLAAFLQRVDVGMVAVAHIGQLLGQCVVVVAGAEAERGQRDARPALVGHHRFQRILADGADVEVAIGGQDHAVHAFLDEGLLRHRVRQPYAVAAVGAAPGLQPVQRGEDLLVAVARRGRQHQSGRARIDHDADAVLTAQLRHQLGEGLLQQRQLVRRFHRTRRVQQEHQVGRRQRRLGYVVALDADHQQLALGVPGRRGEFGGDVERTAAVRRCGMTVAEVVDEFLRAHGVGRRTLALAQHASHIAVAAGVDVDGERGDGFVQGALDRIVVAFGVLLGVGRRGGLGQRRVGDAVFHRHHRCRRCRRRVDVPRGHDSLGLFAVQAGSGHHDAVQRGLLAACGSRGLVGELGIGRGGGRFRLGRVLCGGTGLAGGQQGGGQQGDGQTVRHGVTPCVGQGVERAGSGNGVARGGGSGAGGCTGPAASVDGAHIHAVVGIQAVFFGEAVQRLVALMEAVGRVHFGLLDMQPPQVRVFPVVLVLQVQRDDAVALRLQLRHDRFQCGTRAMREEIAPDQRLAQVPGSFPGHVVEHLDQLFVGDHVVLLMWRARPAGRALKGGGREPVLGFDAQRQAAIADLCVDALTRRVAGCGSRRPVGASPAGVALAGPMIAVRS